jgi:HD-GYP domain-containing protein (c-di-GMP phosphodiesterase class II)
VTQSPLYIKQVTELGDTQKVVATEDICNEQGVSLAKQGTRIDSSLYDRLVRHKLLRPIDCSVSVENPITQLTLVTEAKQLIASEPDLEQAVDSRFIQRDLLTLLGSVHIEPQLGFKLTLCRERSLERYQHMLRVALISLHVASRLRWPTNERLELAAAAIYHDLGELHLDPSLFDGQPLNLARRRQIFSHPTIAYLILKEFSAYHPRVSFAVHQHHERLDGSGYPKGLSGNEVVPAARVIGASELLAVIRLEPERKDSRLFSTAEVLAFNAEKFGNEIVVPLIDAAKRIEVDSDILSYSGTVNKSVLQARMSLLVDILRGAEELDTGSNNEMTAFISRQLGRISAMSNRCCPNLNTSDDLLTLIGEDSVALSELDALVREMIFLVQSTAREAMRRWVKDALPAHDQAPLARWLKNAEMALHSAGFQAE